MDYPPTSNHAGTMELEERIRGRKFKKLIIDEEVVHQFLPALEEYISRFAIEEYTSSFTTVAHSDIYLVALALDCRDLSNILILTA